MKQSTATILTGIVAFLGAILGNSVAGLYQGSVWEKEANFRNTRALLDKRIDLIEKTVTIFNRRNQALMLSADVELTKQLIDLEKYRLLQMIKSKRPTDKIEVSQLYQKAFDSNYRLNELNKECAVVLTLDALFFGDSTRSVVRRTNQIEPWWKADSLDADRLFAAMYAELGFGLKWH